MKQKIDYTKLSWRDIHHGAFLSEGRMVAFPTCFPGATIPITADESHITALDISPEGDVYGGTSGKAVHLFNGMFRGVTGAVFDMGVAENADHCAAICCGRRSFIASVNGPEGGRLIRARLQGLPFDLLQEWGYSRPAYEEMGYPVEGERILHALPDPTRSIVIGTTENHVWIASLDQKAIEPIGEVKANGKIAMNSEGIAYGLDAGETLWKFDAKTKKLTKRAVSLPAGSWQQGNIQWANDPQAKILYLADDEGKLFTFDANERFTECQVQTSLAPVETMSVTHDGRLFGACGEEMSHLFHYHPKSGEIKNLGIALSTIERRRYGYLFGDSVTGPDGEIYFGEDDDLGHLWIYFPRIEVV